MAGRLVSTCVFALFLSNLAGCSVAGSGEGELQIEIATYQQTGRGGDNAQMRGELVDREGCLVIRDEHGEHRLLVWPANKVSTSRGRLRLMGKSYVLGDTVEVGGGRLESIENLEGAQVPDSCRALNLQMFLVSAG